MTDEEKAEEYIINKYYKDWLEEESREVILEDVYNHDKKEMEGFIAGLAEGRKEIEKMKKEIINLRKVINTLYTTDLSDIEEVGRIIDIGRYGNYGDL